MNHFELSGGELACEEAPLSQIAEAVGTPVYVYSSATLERHFTVFRDALTAHPEIGEPLIAYALKANSNVAVVRTLARLGAGAKANHLAYIGDASIGEGANIGAGTITCNFDGRDKHRTEIGKNAFIGSNSALVAPVKIGEGAYIGSGSVITRDVPADALAIGRGQQVVKAGWARRLRDLQSANKKRTPAT